MHGTSTTRRFRLSPGLFRAQLPLLAVVTLAAGEGTGPTWASERGEAPFKKSLYTKRLALTEWLPPDATPERWVGKKLFLDDVYLMAKGVRSNDLYATSCRGGTQPRPGSEVIAVSCPLVYPGKLSPDEARRRLEEASDRTVDVYLTVGQLIPRQFASSFGMLEAKNGAWVETEGDYFYVRRDVRAFIEPGEETIVEPGAARAEGQGSEPSPPEGKRGRQRYFVFEYRRLREGDGEFRAIERTTLFSGETEFRVTTSAPQWFAIELMTIWDREAVDLGGGRQYLCRSSVPANSCVTDFGPEIAGQRLRVETRIRDADGERHVVSREFATLDTHPSRFGAPGFFRHSERESVEQHPIDEVIRLVRCEITPARGDDVEYRVDLPVDGFHANVAGIKGVKIKSVRPPPVTRSEEDSKILIPLFVSVAPYFLERKRGEPALDWLESYTRQDGGIVASLRQGLEQAARSGVEAEFLVVSYARTARLFRPFRLHCGEHLAPEQQEHNRRTLDALADHLLEPPLPEWAEKREGKWVSDLSAPLHTLNDLYFRTYPGRVGAILITDGWNNPAQPEPRFQRDLWPERLAELNRSISREEVAQVLRMLDQGRSLRDEAVDRFLVELSPEDDASAGLLAEHLRQFDPGGMSTLHPQKENRTPQLDALLIPSATSLRREMQQAFTQMIREDFGGEVYRHFKLQKSNVERLEEKIHRRSDFRGTVTVGKLIRRVRDQLRASYEITLDVPNERHDGARHRLKFRVKPRTASGDEIARGKGRLHYVPYYTSSRSAQEKLPILAGNPLSLMRLLAAYEFRDYWDDPSLQRVLERRIADEGDPHVRRVLFESAVVMDLKRLQAGAAEIDGGRGRADPGEVHDRLRSLAHGADETPDPPLARDAARLADWYRRDFETQALPGLR